MEPTIVEACVARSEAVLRHRLRDVSVEDIETIVYETLRTARDRVVELSDSPESVDAKYAQAIRDAQAELEGPGV
jgi:hypothetical protein